MINAPWPDRLIQRSTAYLPGDADPHDGQSLRAVLNVLAHFSGLLDQALGQTADKHFLALIDSLGVDLLAPSAARAPLVFVLAPDAPTDVPLQAGTVVASAETLTLPQSLAATASSARPPAKAPVLFATERALTLARAAIGTVITTNPELDSYAEFTENLDSGITLFEAHKQIPHHLYIGHDTLFELSSTATVSLQIGVRSRGLAPVELRWEYATQAGWLPFDPVNDRTRGLSVDGEVLLSKTCGPPAAKSTVSGIESFWIRARVTSPLPRNGADGTVAGATLPQLDSIRARVGHGESGLQPDACFSAGLRLDTSKEFQPFGPRPEVGSAFVVSCADAFKRPGAHIKVTFQPTKSGPASDPHRSVVWEYSTGLSNWSTLEVRRPEQFEAGLTARSIEFDRPDDWSETAVNGEKGFWIRARIADGPVYGGPPPLTYNPPVLFRITVDYEIQTGPQIPEYTLARNLFTFVDHSDACRWGRGPFQPFRPLDDRLPTIAIGFTVPLPTGLVSMLAVAPARDDASVTSNSTVWEFQASSGWQELPAIDETLGLTRTGLLQFVGPVGHVAAAGPREPQYWIRAVLRNEGASPVSRPIEGLHLNSIWARQRTSVRDEVLGTSDGTACLTMRTRNHPLVEGETIEIQEWRGQGRGWESQFEDVTAERLRFERDGGDRVIGVWVSWVGCSHLYRSAQRDRHYVVERATGTIRFGDGTAGMIPPAGAPILVSYDHDAGSRGNIPAGQIRNLQSAAPYVDRVYNPLPATGGADGEQPDKTVAHMQRLRWRGSNQLRHRGRAITATDYEWIARNSSPEVAIARCLPTTAADGMREGWVTIVIAPWSMEPEPHPSAELVRVVRSYVSERAPAAVASAIRVVGPTYRPVSISAQVAVADISRAAEVEERLREQINAYLHPVGNGARQPWHFGDSIRLSTLAHLAHNIPGVVRADGLTMSSTDGVAGDQLPLRSNELPSAGTHVIAVRPLADMGC